MAYVQAGGLLARSAFLAILVAACSGSASSPTASAPPAASSPTPTSTPVAEPTRPTCPSPHGGSCLGPLEPGTYETVRFVTPITYTVPAGWANFEDLPGNFLLIPPGGSNDGVDAGTSDYIGIYQGVEIAVAVEACRAAPDPEVGRSPEAMLAALAASPGLAVTEPEPVVIGGLEGLSADIRLVEGWEGTCPDAPFPLVPLTIGGSPAELEHAQIPMMTTRLSILELGDTNIVIEISDIDDAPGGIGDPAYEAVIAGLVFGLP
jgi:hypothetical protein